MHSQWEKDLGKIGNILESMNVRKKVNTSVNVLFQLNVFMFEWFESVEVCGTSSGPTVFAPSALIEVGILTLNSRENMNVMEKFESFR